MGGLIWGAWYGENVPNLDPNVRGDEREIERARYRIPACRGGQHPNSVRTFLH